MKKEKKRKLNYVKVSIFIIVLILLIWGIIRLFSTLTTSSDVAIKESNIIETSANVTTTNASLEENKVANSTTTDNNTTGNETLVNNAEVITVGSVGNETSRTSRAIQLKSGEKSKNSLAVLMYHYFYDKSKGESAKNSNWMEISKFEEQLKYLKENDYYYPTWQEVSDFVDGKIDLPEKSVVITMDDGHKSIYSLSIPLLEKYNIPATAFIITSKFDTKNVEKYKNSTIDFESHTDNMHRAGGNIGHGGIFPALSIEEGVTDLKKSIEKLGGNSSALAYPYGDCTESTKKAASQAGFKVAFTTVNKKVKPGMDKYELPRVRMYTEISLSGFKASI